jgi:hypothetical protein
MATEILSTASTAADSSDVVVASGEVLSVSLKGVANGQARVIVYLKDDASAYQVIGELTSHRPSMAITSPGTYRFSRAAGAACGVFSG